MIETLPSATTLGGYQLLYLLKSGGMGEVLLARKRGPSGFERLAAVKTIRGDLRGFDHLRRMFLDEASLLGRLSHPAIAKIYDFGEDEETLFLAMEYVAGPRFRDLAIRRDLRPDMCARAMAEVCRGLHAAHELTDPDGHALGVVHRDVSPDNLMLTFYGQIKVLDFGIALMRGGQAPVTELGTIKGKPPYLAPEQLKNGVVDRRTDVFAAAVVLHELLTGQQVFRGDSPFAVARAVELDPIDPPSVLAGELPPGLDDVVMRGLARDPAERWQTAAEMARALDEVASAQGGETLADYAARTLANEGKAHRRWLARLLEQADGETASAADAALRRTSGVMTVPRASEPRVRGEVQRTGTVQMAAARAPRSRTLCVVTGAAVVAAIGVALGWGVARPAPQGDPASKAQAPARTGTITIDAHPYAGVRVDGTWFGNTTIVARAIEAGPHVIEFIDPASQAVRATVRVIVEPGRLTTVTDGR